MNNLALNPELASAILDVANQPVTYIRRSGRRSVITRFQAYVIELSYGRPRAGQAKTDFIDLVLDAAAYLQRRERAEVATGASLRHAIEHGSDAEFEREWRRYFDALPLPSELSDSELEALTRRQQRRGSHN